MGLLSLAAGTDATVLDDVAKEAELLEMDGFEEVIVGLDPGRRRGRAASFLAACFEVSFRPGGGPAAAAVDLSPIGAA
jgi:hypothetical protein